MPKTARMSSFPLTAEMVRELLNYDPLTGIFTRRTKWRSKNVGDVPGTRSPQGYWYIGVRNLARPAHRLAWLHFYGEWPNGDIDHINRDRMDNRIVNLRDVSRSVNIHNALGKNPASGVKGVHRDGGDSNRWIARIEINRKTYRFGPFATINEATAARGFAESLFGVIPPV